MLTSKCFTFIYIKHHYTTAKKIGFIGLGQMGRPMVENMLQKHQNVTVYDHFAAARNHFFERAKVVDSMSGLKDRDVMITMLPTAENLESAIFEKGGLVSLLKPGSTIINCGTIGVGATQSIIQRLPLNVNFIDAPVSGGTMGAKAATLTFMASGNEDVITDIESILLSMGKRIVRCGEAGKGQAAKICNNMLLAITMQGVSETFALAKAMGLDPRLLSDIINTSSGRCWVTEVNHPVPGIVANSPSSRDYENGFSNMLLLKDIRLAQAENNSKELKLDALDSVEKSYTQMLNSKPEVKSKDMSYIYEYLINQSKK